MKLVLLQGRGGVELKGVRDLAQGVEGQPLVHLLLVQGNPVVSHSTYSLSDEDGDGTVFVKLGEEAPRSGSARWTSPSAASVTEPWWSTGAR